MASLNSHGTITEANLEQRIAECTRYKPHRLQLSRIVHRALVQLGVEHFLEGGTLLGAYRSGKMLPWDDDFDFGIFANLCAQTTDDSVVNLYLENDLQQKIQAYLENLCSCLREWLARQQMTDIACRVVTSYACKVEVYLPEHGNYPFRDTNYHNVSCDLTLFTPHPESSAHLQLHHSQLQHLQITRNSVLPLSSILYENEPYPAPASPHDFLTQIYGYLGSDAVYDAETGKYRKK